MIRDMVTRRHGVYALYSKGRLYYVGLASNLRGRLRQHVRDRHAGRWDVFSVYLTIDDGHMRELESLVVRIASPKGNKQRGKFAHAENLMPSLKRALRARQRTELQSLGSRWIAKDPLRGRRARQKPVERGTPALARFVTKSLKLRCVRGGKNIKARIAKDGWIHVGPKRYRSPSGAGAAVMGHQVNGWALWTYERAPGQWVKLRELKRR
ncbi:MAG: GIY-YIG nuclease family protein [Vicinamibacterales bacterium]